MTIPRCVICGTTLSRIVYLDGRPDLVYCAVCSTERKVPRNELSDHEGGDMSDGAHLGVSADRALGTILGGEPSPEEDEQMGVIEFRAYIMQPDQEALDYGEAARRVARMILEFFMADPHRATIPTETVYQQPVDWSNPVVLERDLYAVMKDNGIPLADLGLSGFQWGWAVNAARRCVELEPVSNPAIVTIGGGV